MSGEVGSKVPRLWVDFIWLGWKAMISLASFIGLFLFFKAITPSYPCSSKNVFTRSVKAKCLL